MNALPDQPSPEPPEALLIPAPARTLRDGLAWLGHRCVDGCPAAVLGLDALPATVCFVRRGPRRRAGFAGRIVVDARVSGLPRVSAGQLVDAVDACARADGIVVRIRSGPGGTGR
jgi:hypothetical protein